MLSKGENKTKQVKNKFITSQLNGQRRSQHSAQLELKILGSFLSFWLASASKSEILSRILASFSKPSVSPCNPAIIGAGKTVFPPPL